MSLSIGIVGLPNVGKSTLFNALTNNRVLAANYPFATIDPSVGIVPVPDERRKKLALKFNSKRDVPAVVEFVDIAGLVRGASAGEGLGNKFLSHIRKVDAVCFVLRNFEDENIINTESGVDPVRDRDILDTELSLKDLDIVLKRIDNIEKDVKANKKGSQEEKLVLEKAKEILNSGGILYGDNLNEEERRTLSQYQLLTLKPRIYIVNQGSKEVGQDVVSELEKTGEVILLNIADEFSASELSTEEKKALGLSSSVGSLVKTAYKLLGLISFFTTGEDETRAWTVRQGSVAPVAAGVIHTDFKEKFIRADVIAWDKLLEAGSRAVAREKGLIRIEGRDYVVKDGDVLEIKHAP